jgi:hypothetical protein
MGVSRRTLLVLGFVFSRCVLDTYGDNTDTEKGINNGLNLQLPMVSSSLCYYLNFWKIFVNL